MPAIVWVNGVFHRCLWKAGPFRLTLSWPQCRGESGPGGRHRPVGGLRRRLVAPVVGYGSVASTEAFRESASMSADCAQSDQFLGARIHLCDLPAWKSVILRSVV